jgi:hypothetical protein
VCYLFKIIALFGSFFSTQQPLSQELLQKIDQQTTVFNTQEMQQWFAKQDDDKQEEIKRTGISWIAQKAYHPSGWRFPNSRYVQAIQWLLAQGASLHHGKPPENRRFSPSTIEVLLDHLITNHEAFNVIFIDNAIVIPAVLLKMQYDFIPRYKYWDWFVRPLCNNYNPQPMTESSCSVLHYLLVNDLDIKTPAKGSSRGIYEIVLNPLDNDNSIAKQNWQKIKEIMNEFLVHQRQGNLENSLHDPRLMDVMIRCNH